MRTRLTSALTVAVLAFGLAACDSGGDAGTEAEAPAPAGGLATDPAAPADPALEPTE